MNEYFKQSIFDKDLLSNITKKIHSEALRYSKLKDEPEDNIFELLIKNVSRESPLSTDEIDTLTAFKASISENQWNMLLKEARKERKKRLNAIFEKKVESDGNKLNDNDRNNEKKIKNNQNSQSFSFVTSLEAEEQPTDTNLDQNFEEKTESNYSMNTPSAKRGSIFYLTKVNHDLTDFRSKSTPQHNLSVKESNREVFAPNSKVKHGVSISISNLQNNNGNSSHRFSNSFSVRKNEPTIENSKFPADLGAKSSKMVFDSPEKSKFYSTFGSIHSKNLDKSYVPKSIKKDNMRDEYSEFLDTIKSSSTRLDSAYSAAKCLLSTLASEEADFDSSSYLIKSGKKILREIMKSMEKSKNGLDKYIEESSIDHLIDFHDNKNNEDTFRFSSNETEQANSITNTKEFSSDLSLENFMNINELDVSKEDFRVDQSKKPFSSTINRPFSYSGSYHPYSEEAEKPHPSFQYDQNGYYWGGVKYNTAQGFISRICVAQGPLVKEFPIRVDVESSAVDLVWREVKSSQVIKQSLKEKYEKSKVLRRERFSFDDVFAGKSAQGRLMAYVKQRTRKALESASDVTFLCLACGEYDEKTSILEPPMNIIFGLGGGTGIACNLIEEVLNYIQPLTSSIVDGSFPGFTHQSNRNIQGQYLTSKVAYEQLHSKVLISAGIVVENKVIIDLLGKNGQSFCSDIKINRKSNGKLEIGNLEKVELKSTSDLDRIAGVIVGKKSASSSIIKILKDKWNGNNNLKNEIENIEQSILWDHLLGAHQGVNFSKKHSSTTGTILVTISVTGGGISKLQNSANFNFVAPCGDGWANPALDINILAESISCWPNLPIPRIYNSYPVVKYLLDPKSRDLNFINLLFVNRLNKKRDYKESYNSQVAEDALNSFRIISQTTQ